MPSTATMFIFVVLNQTAFNSTYQFDGCGISERDCGLACRSEKWNTTKRCRRECCSAPRPEACICKIRSEQLRERALRRDAADTIIDERNLLRYTDMKDRSPVAHDQLMPERNGLAFVPR